MVSRYVSSVPVKPEGLCLLPPPPHQSHYRMIPPQSKSILLCTWLPNLAAPIISIFSTLINQKCLLQLSKTLCPSIQSQVIKLISSSFSFVNFHFNKRKIFNHFYFATNFLRISEVCILLTNNFTLTKLTVMLLVHLILI